MYKYEYEYLYDDLHICYICKKYIEHRYCVFRTKNIKYYYHKDCFLKLLE